MTTQMIALSHCPFCKSRCVTGWTETDGNDVITDAWIECDDCFSRGPSADTEDEAAGKWNAATAEGISQQIGKDRDNEAALDKSNIDAAHQEHQEIERLRAEVEQLKAERASSVRMYPGFQYRMYPRSKYGE
jgi:hypothetical protein